jgi:hypothetical protein
MVLHNQMFSLNQVLLVGRIEKTRFYKYVQRFFMLKRNSHTTKKMVSHHERTLQV